MRHVRLQTKFLLSLVLVSTVLTCATLLIVQHRARLQAQEVTFDAMHSSLAAFQNFQRQREAALTRSAGLLADLPNLRALMTTEDAATIQDGSFRLWRLAGSDLFVLANRAGKVVALQTTAAGFNRGEAQESLRVSLQNGDARDWWFGGGRLYEVFIQPIYFGPASENTLLGVLAVGYEIDSAMAGAVSRIAASHVVFRYGKTVVVSTLPAGKQAALEQEAPAFPGGRDAPPEDIQLADERFLAASVALPPGDPPKASLTVLESYDQATQSLTSLNHLLIGIGVAAILIGSILIFLISHTFTKPLESLVAGVRALETGDFTYPLEARSGDEVGELTEAFDRMRRTLRRTQEELLHAERLATIGRMASLISHDLRHPLTAILAYAEFLSEGGLEPQQRQEHYEEIRQAVNRMTDLIGSLLEFSRARQALSPVYGSVDETIQRAIRTVRARPEFRGIDISLSQEGPAEGWFDPKKLERVFYNLLLNACEAVPPQKGKIEVSAHALKDALEIRVSDNGPGIPEPLRGKIFEPFVSYGKENGTGLGLAVVLKIIQDHGGGIAVENNATGGASFRLTLPLTLPPEKVAKS